MHLYLLSIISLAIGLVGKFEPARLFLGWQALKKARPEDVPAVLEASARWQHPRRTKQR